MEASSLSRKHEVSLIPYDCTSQTPLHAHPPPFDRVDTRSNYLYIQAEKGASMRGYDANKLDDVPSTAAECDVLLNSPSERGTAVELRILLALHPLGGGSPPIARLVSIRKASTCCIRQNANVMIPCLSKDVLPGKKDHNGLKEFPRTRLEPEDLSFSKAVFTSANFLHHIVHQSHCP